MAKNLTDIYAGVDKSDPERKKNDFYPTPALATYALVRTLGEDMPHIIIEPCAGRGHISVELDRNGFTVTSYDLNAYENSLVKVTTGVDAMTLGKHGHLHGVVTNPPYHKDLPRKLAAKFVEEYDFTAMFVRLTFLEGKARRKLFTKHPPSDIIFLSDRVNFGPAGSSVVEPIEKKDQIGGMIAYMWIVWNNRSLHINTRMHWVELDELYDDWRLQYEAHQRGDTCRRRSDPLASTYLKLLEGDGAHSWSSSTRLHTRRDLQKFF